MTLWTVARRAPLSKAFSRQEHWSGLPFPPPGDIPNWWTESPALAGGFFTAEPWWEPHTYQNSQNDKDWPTERGWDEMWNSWNSRRRWPTRETIRPPWTQRVFVSDTGAATRVGSPFLRTQGKWERTSMRRSGHGGSQRLCNSPDLQTMQTATSRGSDKPTVLPSHGDYHPAAQRDKLVSTHHHQAVSG